MSAPSFTLEKVKAPIIPQLKDFLDAVKLPTEDIHEDMTLYYAQDAEGLLMASGGYEQFGSDGLLRSLAIRSPKQGKGLGKAWLELLLEKAEELGMKNIYLLTTTAEGFFQKMGFQKVSRELAPVSIQQSEEFSSICPSSAVFMHLALST